MRAVAAYMVFVHHVNPFSSRFGIIAAFVQECYVGVSIFFVLSGFLITIRYYEKATLSTSWFIRYVQNRIAKIYPLFFLLTTFTFLVSDEGQSFLIYIANITFLKGFFDDCKFTGISQGWSLTVEESFYLLAPFIFISIKKYSTILVQPVLFLLTGFVLVKMFHRIDFYGFFESNYFMLMYTFFGRCLEFFAGIALARFYMQRNFKTSSSSVLFTSTGVIGLAVSILTLAIVKDDFDYGTMTTAGLLIHHLVVPVFTALWFWGLMTEKSGLRRLLELPFSQLLGKSSYAFYLVHIGIFYNWIAGYISGNILVIFVSFNLLAIGLYQFIEQPLNKKIRDMKLIS